MAKKWGQRVRDWMAQKMDLPQDVAMDLPRITMIGQIHIYIENHRGLLTFTDKERSPSTSPGHTGCHPVG